MNDVPLAPQGNSSDHEGPATIARPPLRHYQIADLAFYLSHSRGANLSDPGTGKTPSVCVYQQVLWEDQRCRSAWAQPKSLLTKNRDEILRFTELRPQDVVIVDGSPLDRLAQMESDAKVFLMGFDRFAEDWQALLRLHADLGALQVDEMHLGWSTDKSARTQALYRAMEHFTYFLPMTGTLIRGRLDSAYPTIRVIDRNYYGSHAAFMSHHADFDEHGRVVTWKNHETLAAAFGRHGIRRSFYDVYPDAKRPVILTERCDMAAAQRKAYDEFEQRAILELEDRFLASWGIGGVHAMRCRQILQCPQIFGLCRDETIGKDQRIEIHLEDHARSRTPFVLFSSFIAEQERLTKLVRSRGLRCGLINGNVAADRRAIVDQQFRAGILDGVVASPQTAGIGYNWEHAEHVLFASLDYMDDSFVQGYRRCDRGTRRTPLRVTVLEYKSSIDQRIFQIVQRKSSDACKVDPTRERVQLTT